MNGENGTEAHLGANMDGLSPDSADLQAELPVQSSPQNVESAEEVTPRSITAEEEVTPRSITAEDEVVPQDVVEAVAEVQQDFGNVGLGDVGDFEQPQELSPEMAGDDLPAFTSTFQGEARVEWRAKNEERLKEHVRVEAELKRELVQAGHAELEKMHRAAKEEGEKRKKACLEENARKESEWASTIADPMAKRTRAESWNAVYEMIDFKKDTKVDLSAMKSMIIQLKHGGGD